MFIDEAKISVQLNHANIAQIFDLGQHRRQLLHRDGVHPRQGPARDLRPLPASKGEPLPVAAGLLHRRARSARASTTRTARRTRSGRDLQHRPPRRLAAERPRLATRARSSSSTSASPRRPARRPKTQAGILKGKFGYMSPEQVRGLPHRPPQRRLRRRRRASTRCSPASGCSSARATSRRWRRCATSRCCRRRRTTGRSPRSSSGSC